VPVAPPSAIDQDLLEASRLKSIGRGRDAETLLRRVLDQIPEHPAALVWLAEIEVERKEIASAIAHAEAVLRHEPNHAPALAVMAQAKWIGGRPHEGLIDARRAVAIQPPNPHLRIVLAQLCIWLGEHVEAAAMIEVLRGMGRDDPVSQARAHGLAGELLIAQGRFADAVPELESALAIWPRHAPTQMLYSLNMLRLGRFTEGWRAYAFNREVPFYHPAGTPDLPGVSWSGEPLAGKTILLQDDQGFGDAVQYFRYLWRVRELGPRRIILACFSPLLRLFAAAAPFAEVRDTTPGREEGIDFHCLTTDLPYVFRTDFATLPATVPYLTAVSREPALPAGSGLKVGLVWSGDPRHMRDHQRSIPADRFLTIADVPGVRYFCMQPAVRERDLPALQAASRVVWFGRDMTDFADTAAVLVQLDLLITVDTGIAHLAGALGVPTWLLLPITPDWRWFTDRDDSPWYPALRLFRADADGWGPVLGRVQAALRARVAARSRPRGRTAV
jgi:tetratricopeptide (TPR) repeat protein